ARNLFQEALERTRLRNRLIVAGYVVMPEHIHLLIGEPLHGPIAAAVKRRRIERIGFPCPKSGTWGTHFSTQSPRTRATRQSYNVTFPANHKAVVTLSGLGQDPLELQLGGIQWNATITLDTTNPNNPTAQATITHICYPAHIVKVNGVIIINDMPGPTENTTPFVVKCLGDPTHLTWITTTSEVTSVPTH